MGTSDRERAIIYSCWYNNVDEYFDFHDKGTAGMTIQVHPSRSTDRCLDVAGGSSSSPNGTPVNYYGCTGGANQMWEWWPKASKVSNAQATWENEDLLAVTKKNPVFFMTAPNDGAPLTAKHELGCFDGSIDEESTAIFAEFNDGGSPETRWVLAAAKLYTHMEGAEDSKCYSLIWGNETDSLRNSPDLENQVFSNPELAEEVQLYVQ